MDRSNWNYQDYLAFTLVYAANADFRIREVEEEVLIKKVGEDLFEKQRRYFKRFKDLERIDVVYEFRDKYCNTETERNKVLADIKEIISSDHHASEEEHEIYLFIKKILTH